MVLVLPSVPLGHGPGVPEGEGCEGQALTAAADGLQQGLRAMGDQNEVGIRRRLLEGLEQDVAAGFVEAMRLLHQDPAVATHGWRQGRPLDDASAETRLIARVQALADLINADHAGFALRRNPKQVWQLEGQVVSSEQLAALA